MMDAFKNSTVYKDRIISVTQNGDCYAIYFKNDEIIIEKLTASQQQQSEYYRPILICLNFNV